MNSNTFAHQIWMTRNIAFINYFRTLDIFQSTYHKRWIMQTNNKRDRDRDRKTNGQREIK